MFRKDYPVFPLAKEIKDYFDDFIDHFKFGEVFNYGNEVI